MSAELTFLSAELAFLSAGLTSLSAKLTFLSAKLTFLSAELTSLSAELAFLSAKLTFLSAGLTFLSAKHVSLSTDFPLEADHLNYQKTVQEAGFLTFWTVSSNGYIRFGQKLHFFPKSTKTAGMSIGRTMNVSIKIPNAIMKPNSFSS